MVRLSDGRCPVGTCMIEYFIFKSGLTRSWVQQICRVLLNQNKIARTFHVDKFVCRIDFQSNWSYCQPGGGHEYRATNQKVVGP